MSDNTQPFSGQALFITSIARSPLLIRTPFSPYGIFPIAAENKYLWTFSYLIMKFYVLCTHLYPLISDFNEYTQHTCTIII